MTIPEDKPPYQQLAREILDIKASIGEGFTFFMALLGQGFQGSFLSRPNALSTDEIDHISAHQKALTRFIEAMRNLAMIDNHQITNSDRAALEQFPTILRFLKEQWQKPDNLKLTEQDTLDNSQIASLIDAMTRLSPDSTVGENIDKVNNISTSNYLLADKLDPEIRPKLQELCRMLGVIPIPERDRS